MKRIILLTRIILAITIIIGVFVPDSEARWSSNDRRAVVLEAFYALRLSHDGGCDKTINGNCISNWNCLNNDPYAYNAVKKDMEAILLFGHCFIPVFLLMVIAYPEDITDKLGEVVNANTSPILSYIDQMQQAD